MKRYQNNSVLIFGDVHSPVTNKDTLAFLKELKDKYEPDRIICNGDLTDSYNFSSYTRDLSAAKVSDELKSLRQFTKKLGALFPDMIITDSNHDSRLWRKSTIAGIPREVIIPYKTLIGADNFNWKLVPDITLTIDKTREQVYVAHTRSGTTFNTSKHMGRSVVLSHHHTKQGIQYWASDYKVHFAVDTGCLIDAASYAFAYDKLNPHRPLLGACILLDGEPLIERM